MPQIPSGFGQNRGILFFAEDNGLAAPQGPTWKEVKEAVERLVHVTEILLAILHQKDGSFGELKAIAAEVANDFWEVS
jgi:hypothetical protein